MLTHKILVLDAAQRSALAVVRSLGQMPAIQVITADSRARALAGESRFSNAYVQSPCPASSPEKYLAWIKDFCAQSPVDLVIPVTEITSQLLLKNQETLPGVRLPFAGYETVMALTDKHRLLCEAEAANVPVPAFTYYPNASALNPQSLQFPCVIKPALSRIFTEGHWISTSVKILYSLADWEKALSNSPYLQQHPFMVQAFIPGSGAGVFYLYHQGKPVCYFAHKRLREKPPQGGVSVLSESILPDPRLLVYARQLLDSVGWHGVAMVEFRVTPEGEPYLMEVNTRFWGSLQLAIDAGIDFPRLLVEDALGRQVNAPSRYQVGCQLRWLLGDLDSLYLMFRSAQPWATKLKYLLQFLAPSLSRRHEVNRWGDFKPAWFELKQYVAQLLGLRHP